MNAVILAVIAAVLTGTAMSLQKAGLNKLGKVKKINLRLVKKLIKNKLWMTGLIISGIPVVLFTWLLSFEEVSVINPLMSLSLLVILFNGYFFLKEKLTTKQLIGAVSLIIGSVIMGFTA
jgi:drug/metabolite transporter (DMT)-like permease